jgi:hypothetical protein
MEAFRMMKKKPVHTEPTVSNIPIPVSDNPIVIDLPDGQKIVLGKFSPGSVIEVATWRGTGRPDSRTNRVMLGVSDGSTPVSAQAAPEVAQNKPIDKLQGLWKRKSMSSTQSQSDFSVPSERMTYRSTGFIARFVGGTVGSVSKALKRTKDLTPIETTQDLDINAWIQNISREAEVKVARKSAKQAAASSKKAPSAKKATTTKKSASKKRK